MDAKACSRCRVVKPPSEFSRKGEGLQPMCKSCNRAYQREHYLANKPSYQRKARTYANRQKADIRRWVWEYLEERGCCDCGVRDPRVLEFDHRSPSAKSFQISQALSGSYTLERVRQEVAKCDVRCANCHRIRTADQLNWYAWREAPDRPRSSSG